MEDKKDSFNDYVYRGMDSLLKLTSRAGDSLRVASNNAIDRIDYLRLEKKLERLYGDFGKLAFNTLSSGLDLDSGDETVLALVSSIETVTAELARRASCKPYGEKEEKKGEKNKTPIDHLSAG